jgi:hypothetical protein
MRVFGRYATLGKLAPLLVLVLVLITRNPTHTFLPNNVQEVHADTHIDNLVQFVVVEGKSKAKMQWQDSQIKV